MALFTQAELTGAFPELDQLLALDDNSDNQADSGLVEAVLADAVTWLEGYLEPAGLTLADPAPKRLKHLGMRYAEYTLWRRRGHAERAKQVYDEWIKPGMDWLARISDGTETLAPETSSDGLAITEPARTHSMSGDLMI